MRLAVVVSALLALPAVALAHGGGPVIPDAVAALEHGRIYVDYDAKPTLTELEADALGRRLAQKPGVYVAVLPTSVAEELQTDPLGVAVEMRRQVGRDGLYVVSVGGRLAAWSALDGSVSIPPGGSLDERLTTMVDAVLPYSAPQEESGRPWVWIGLGVGLVLLAATALVLAVARRRVSSRS